MRWFRRGGKNGHRVTLNVDLTTHHTAAAAALWASMQKHTGEAGYPWAELDNAGQAMVREVAKDVVRAVAPGIVSEAVHSALACVGLRPADGVEVLNKDGAR